MAKPTPGQVNYEAYLCAAGHPRFRRWDELRHSQQQRWEAAAQAVLGRREETHDAPEG